MPRQYPIEKTRNIGIILHNDASRSLNLVDSFALFETKRFQNFRLGKTPVFPTPFPASMRAIDC